MVVNIKKITSAVNKVNDLASCDNMAKPGFLFKIAKDTEVTGEENENGTLAVCYSDGHKSLIEYLPVEVEDTDIIDKEFVVEFMPLINAIQKCQPLGIVKCNEVQFSFHENDILRISAKQDMEDCDADGNVVGARTLGNKQIDLKWITPASNIKASILSRMKYGSIFEPEATVDTYDKKEFIDILSRTATEKGKSIYISNKTQSAFVANQAHLTIVPVSQYEELSSEELDEIRGELSEQGIYSEENLKKAIADRESRVHNAIVIKQDVAKALISILNKCESDNIAIHRSNNKYCNIMVDGEDNEKVGIWFEMAPANKSHIGAVEKYSSLRFGNYQLMFIREFLVSSIKSACGNDKDGRAIFKFEETQLDDPASNIDLVITGVNNNDTYRINIDAVADTAGNLIGQKFTVNLKLINDMLAQLKTTYVAFDIDINDNDVTSKCLRLAEVDTDKLTTSYKQLRERTKELCEQQGIKFDSNSTPTPVELKIGARGEYLITKQYTMLAK